MIKKIYRKIAEGISLAYVLSPNIWRGGQFFVIYMLIPLAKRLSFKERPWPLFISYKGRSVKTWAFSTTDFAVMKEVFIDKEYALEDGFVPKVILDIGSNTGYSVIYWKLTYPESRVYAFEPEPETFSKLERNTASLSKVVSINSAIANFSGQIDFYTHPESSISSSLRQRDLRSTKIKVKAMTLGEALESALGTADLIKFDVEGAEFSIFESNKSGAVGRLIGEYHEDLAGKSLPEFLALFPGYRSEVRKVSSCRYIVSLTKHD